MRMGVCVAFSLHCIASALHCIAMRLRCIALRLRCIAFALRREGSPGKLDWQNFASRLL